MHSVQKAVIIIKSCTQKRSWKEVVKPSKLHPPTQQILNGLPSKRSALSLNTQPIAH